MRHLPMTFLEDVYFKIIISSVTYCVAAWGSCSEGFFQDIEKIHMRAAKYIHGITCDKSNEDI